MNAAKVLTTAVEVIGVLFAAFGGFLLGFAPPESSIGGASVQQSVGIVSFAALLFLLILASLPPTAYKGKKRRLWAILGFVAASGFLFASLQYVERRSELVFTYPSEGGPNAISVVRGLEHTPRAAEYVRASKDSILPGDLLAAFDGRKNIELVWTRASIRAAETRLLYWYVAMVLCVAIGIFGLVESIAANRKPQS